MFSARVSTAPNVACSQPEWLSQRGAFEALPDSSFRFRLEDALLCTVTCRMPGLLLLLPGAGDKNEWVKRLEIDAIGFDCWLAFINLVNPRCEGEYLG